MQKEERKKIRTEGQVTIEQSSGNVFADLAFKNPEEMLAKRSSRNASVTSLPNAS